MTMTFEKADSTYYQMINKTLQEKDSLAVIQWAYDNFGDKLVYACSFGVEGIVLIDLIYQVNKQAKVIFLDTNFHFKETYQLIDRVKAKYPELNIELREPGLTPEEQAEQHGNQLWKSNPDLCCSIRKITPLKEALADAEAWFSGLRREQSPSRAKTNYVNQDNKFHKIKVCPLIHWTWDEIWDYVETNQLPYNELHDQNYPSIGCEFCTSAVTDGNSSRLGRWAGITKTECGLHG